MREVPSSFVLHPSLGSSCTSSQERSSSFGHIRDGGEGGTEQCWVQRQAEGQKHCSGRCRDLSREEVGTSPSNEGKMAETATERGGQEPEFDGAVRGATKTSDSSAPAFRGDGNYPWKKDSEARSNGGGIGVRHPLSPLMESGRNTSIVSPVNKSNYEVKVDPKIHVVNYENTAIIQDDDMAKYDFNMDVEESWMTDVTYDLLDDGDKNMLNEALHFHHEELEECFHSLRSPEDHPRQLDLMELCCEKDSLLSACMEKSGGTSFRAGLHNGFDLMTEHGTELAIAAVRRLRPKLLWASFPCGPTSPIQALN